MRKALVVIDMQNDFIDGALGTCEAVAIVPAVADKIKSFDGPVIFTRDTHKENYLETQEGKNLPVEHCIMGTEGWNISPLLPTEGAYVLDKPSFGSLELPKLIENLGDIDEIELCGLCTDICVISNAMILKASFPEVSIAVCKDCCAGVTPESHDNALNAMKMCQIKVI